MRLTIWRMGARRLKDRTRVVDGVALLMCLACMKEKPLVPENFPLRSAHEPSGVCRSCKNATKKRYAEEGRLTPSPLEKRRAASRASRRRHRDKRNREAREYKNAVKADPERHARYLETRRIAYRLKAEREGRSVVSTPKARMATSGPSYLPSEPLAGLIDRAIARRAEIASVLDDPTATGVNAVCEDFGVSSRNYRRWRSRSQPHVRVGTAEAVLLAADVEWSEIYSYDDYAHIFLGREACVR